MTTITRTKRYLRTMESSCNKMENEEERPTIQFSNERYDYIHFISCTCVAGIYSELALIESKMR